MTPDGIGDFAHLFGIGGRLLRRPNGTATAAVLRGGGKRKRVDPRVDLGAETASTCPSVMDSAEVRTSRTLSIPGGGGDVGGGGGGGGGDDERRRRTPVSIPLPLLVVLTVVVVVVVAAAAAVMVAGGGGGGGCGDGGQCDGMDCLPNQKKR